MYNLKEIMCEVYQQDFAEFDNPLGHHFSRRSRKKLNSILYPKFPQPVKNHRRIALGKKIAIALLIIILMAVGITAGATIANGFLRKNHSDNTELFTPAAANCPKTIENVYYLPEIPKEYEFYETVSDSENVFTSYMNCDTNRCMVLLQTVKDGYRNHFDNEYVIFEEVNINGNYGLYFPDYDGGLIVWDNGDYILELSGDMNKDVLLNLAKSAKV
ncbi:MAG: DUF4367 domain-containing protein [Oscillospiraceae bacterium]|nr:DUF4367 domain-containing protein [Oscillospiraceae bacterium]